MIPALASARRLTKVLIVNEAIRHLREQNTICIAAAHDMDHLLAENKRLISEVVSLRLQLGLPGQPAPEPMPVTEAMTYLANVQDEIYGSFPGGLENNWAGDGRESQTGRSDRSTVEEEGRLSSDAFLPLSEPSYHPQAYTQNEQNALCVQPLDSLPVPDWGPQDRWNFVSSFDASTMPQYASNPDLFVPATESLENFLPADMPNYSSGFLESTYMDSSILAWAQYVGTDPDVHYGYADAPEPA